MSYGPRAHIVDGPMEFVRNEVRLVFVRYRPDGDDLLMSDGNWVTFDPAVQPGEEVGVLIPRDFVEPLREAIDRFQGNTAHGATEAKVLRESLDIERRRVDDILRGGT